MLSIEADLVADLCCVCKSLEEEAAFFFLEARPFLLLTALSFMLPLSFRVLFGEPALHFDCAFNSIDNGVDVVLAEFREICLRRESIEGLHYCFTLTKKIEQFGVVVAVSLPEKVGGDCGKFMEPFLDADASVFAGESKE